MFGDDGGGGRGKSPSWRLCCLLSRMVHRGRLSNRERTAGEMSVNYQRTSMTSKDRERLRQVEAARKSAFKAASRTSSD